MTIAADPTNMRPKITCNELPFLKAMGSQKVASPMKPAAMCTHLSTVWYSAASKLHPDKTDPGSTDRLSTSTSPVLQIHRPRNCGFELKIRKVAHLVRRH